MTMATAISLGLIQDLIWKGSVPLQIRLANEDCRSYEQSDAYLIQYPRLSYLPLLLPRLHAFFRSSLIQPDTTPSNGWFSYEGVPLQWHYPLGLLYDIYSGADPFFPTQGRQTHDADPAPRRVERRKSNRDPQPAPSHLPFCLTLHYTAWPEDVMVRLDDEGKVLHDAFINSVKEAAFLRNGSAKVVMSLSKNDFTQLWGGVRLNNIRQYNAVYSKLLNSPGSSLRHVPLRVYLPSTIQISASDDAFAGSFRVVQGLVVPILANGKGEAQTLGSALNGLLPSLFIESQHASLAHPVLHGATVPLEALLWDLVRSAAYADGWVHLGLTMIT